MTRSGLLLALAAVVLGVASVTAQAATRRRTADDRLVGVERRRLDVLGLIMEDADRAADKEERARLLLEYLETSEEFVRDHPDSVTAWTGRASAAVELNRPIIAWTAGQALLRLGADRMEEPEVRRALALLDRRGWLQPDAPRVGPKTGEAWENSLGMRFNPVPGSELLFCVWETRVRDFTAFVEAAGYDASFGMLSFDPQESTWKRRGASWRLPGFDQSAEHPVVGLNWYDAKAFCAWLTQREREDGVIAQDQEYRLPFDAEWSVAVGEETFPWGGQWPPPAGAGNFLGEENLPSQLRVLEGFNDRMLRTARVGQFAPNRFGLYDLGGNVGEWCEDFLHDGATVVAFTVPEKFHGLKHRIVRGASWSYQNSANLESQQRHYVDRHQRIDDVGFRCVFATTAQPASVVAIAAADAMGFASGPVEAAPPVSDGPAGPGKLIQPRPLHQVQPDYPYDRWLNSGVVQIEFSIDETGRVKDARVISSTDAAFDAAALAALRDWRFEPAQRDGRPVACRAIQEFRFNGNRLPGPLTP